MKILKLIVKIFLMCYIYKENKQNKKGVVFNEKNTNNYIIYRCYVNAS